MSDTADHLASKKTQDPPGYNVSSQPPPSYSYQDQQPPPYYADPATYTPPKAETSTYQPATGYQSFSDVNPEAPTDTTPLAASSSFDDITVRRAFVRKVFSIITLMLLVTFGIVCLFTFSTVVKDAVQKNMAAYLSSFIIFVVMAITLSCCKSFSRRHPWNIMGLFVITLSFSYMAGTIASFHDTNAVVITMGATLAITVAIIAFSAQARFDFTICSGIVLILVVDIIMFGIFCTFYYSYITDIAYGCLGALLYSLFLMIDVQLLMRSYRVDPEEYVNAALTIYLDIVLIFLCLLGRR